MDLSRSPTRNMVCKRRIFSSSQSKKTAPARTGAFLFQLTASSSQLLLDQLATLVGRNTQTQSIELEKARCIGLVVGASIIFEGSNVGIEQRIVGLAADHDDVALVQFQAHHTVHAQLERVDH